MVSQNLGTEIWGQYTYLELLRSHLRESVSALFFREGWRAFALANARFF